VWAGMNFLPKAGQAFSIGDILAPSAVDIWSGAYWGLITSAFVHVDIIHALFNLWWTKDFGRLLEPRFGAGKFILFVICSAIVSSGWQLAFSDTTGIGFSGVVYAFFGYMLAARRRDPAYGAFLNAKTIRWLIGWFFACIALTWAKIWNIGNFAHGAGLVFGLLIGVSAGAGRFVIPARLAAMGAIISGLIPLFYMPWSASWRIRDQWQHVVQIEKSARRGDPKAQFDHSRIRFGQAEAYRNGTWPAQPGVDVAPLEREGMEFLRKSAEQGYVPAMNNLAWKLSTDDRPNFRNGRESLIWAEKVCEQDQWSSAAYIDTLAAAYAELRRWDEA